MSSRKNKLSPKQIYALHAMIEKRSFYAVVRELHEAAGVAAADNVRETVDNWKDVHAALGCVIGLMDDQELRLGLRDEPEPEPPPQPRGERRIRLR